MVKILFINPNSSVIVTEGIAAAVAPLTPLRGVQFEAVGIADAPATISSETDIAQAALAIGAIAETRRDADVLITACFSDPGLELLRAQSSRPALGLRECGVMMALARADLFGMISLSDNSARRHRAAMRKMGVNARLAGIEPLPGVSAEASGNDDSTYDELVRCGTRLKQLGAGAIVLGCAGMAPIRARLEDELGIAVIDPVVAAGAVALTTQGVTFR